jgi:hypothetical protein
MIPTSFHESNGVIGPPAGVKEEDVGSLSIWRGEDRLGLPLLISCWKLTVEELEEIKRTGRVWLIASAVTIPPVALQVESPFE